MNEFSILFNIEKKLFVNNVMNIIKSPKRLISYALYIAFMTWIVLKNTSGLGSSKEALDIENFIIYASGGVFIFIAFMCYSLTKKNSITFKVSEINLLFPAPLDPRKILMFNVFKKIPIYFLTSVYTLIFLLSVVIRMFKPSGVELAFCCIGYMMIYLILEPLSFCIFVIGTKLKNDKLANRVNKAIIYLLGGILLLSLMSVIKIDGFSVKSMFKAIGADFIDYIPILGWGKHLTLVVINGVTLKTYIIFGLMISTYIGLLVCTYLLGDDYYEDVIELSEERNELIEKARKGKPNISFNKLNFRKGKKLVVKKKGNYAFAFDWKRRILLKRSDFSEYISIETAICALVSVGAFFLLKGDEDSIYGVYIVSVGYFYFKFLFSMQSQLDKELQMHYYYLVPDNAIRKVLAVTKVDLTRFFINSIVIIGIYSALSVNFKLEFVLLPISMLLFYSVMVLSSYLFNLFLPSEDFQRLTVLFKMIQMIILLMPSIITVVIIGVATESPLYALIGSIIINSVLCGVILGMSEFLFSRLELK